MVTIYDPDAKFRAFRNVVSLVFIYGTIIFFFVAIGSYLSILAIEGSSKMSSIIKMDFVKQVDFVYRTITYYFNLWWQYKAKLQFSSNSYFVPKLFTCFISVMSIPVALAIVFRKKIITFRPFKKESSVHGDAHWASYKEMKQAGLRAKKGMLMGQDKKGYLITDGYQHTLLFAPTGSGKGVGFVIPGLLFWEESVICHDIKLENYELTSGWRQKHLKQEVFCWVPADQDGISHCYNPMDWISDLPGKMVDDVQKLAAIILPKQEFWTNEARTLLVGIMLYLVADDSKPNTFGEVVRQIRSDDFAYTLAVVLDTLGDKIHPISYMNISAFLQKADKERSGVVSTLNSGLELWGNPIIDATTSKSDFNFCNFKKKLTTVYVGLTPDNIHRLKPLMRMFYEQATAFMAQHIPTPEEKYGVLFLMDEFPTVGKLEQFLSGIAYFRGYHVRLFLIVQDTQQLKGTYEDTGMNSFLSNSSYRITFAANNTETAKLISDLIGNQTVEQSSVNKPKFFDLNPGSRTTSISQTQRALLLPQEVIGMSKNDQIILVEASPPVKTKKIFYYEDPLFIKRLWKKSFIPIQEPVMPPKRKKKDAEGGDAGGGNAALPAT